MKTASAAFKSRLADEGTFLCRLWFIKLVNGTEFYFTDRPTDVDYNGKTWVSNPGITISAIRNSVEGGFQNAEVNLALNDAQISELSVRRGAIDKASFFIDALHYRNPAAGVMPLFAGQFNDITLSDRGHCTVAVTGTNNRGEVFVGEYYSQRCRNIFGDSRCRMDLEALKGAFTVNVPTADFYNFTHDRTDAVDHWRFGTVKWLTGDNAGTLSEVRKNSAGEVFLASPVNWPIKPGDTGELRPGCSNYRTECRERWNNVLNYRGEPDVPNIGGSAEGPPNAGNYDMPEADSSIAIGTPTST